MFGLFDNLHGIATDAFSARGLSPDEIERYQIANLQASQQAKPSPSYYRLMSNFRQPDLTPLDERFASFKVRLAEALARRAPGQ